MNTTTTQSTADRQRVWDELAAEEAAGTTPAKPMLANEVKEQPAANPPVEQTGTTQQAGDAPVEKFAGLPQDVRDYMAGMQSQIELLTGRVRGTEAHIGGIKSTLKQQREAAQAARVSGGEAPTDAQIKAASEGGKPAMDKLKADYPEFAGHLSDVLQEELAALRTPKPAAHEEQPQAAAAPGPDAIALARRDAFIEASGHAGWQSKIQQPEFVGWFNRQPAEVQMLGHSSDPAHAVRLLNLHKEELAGKGKSLDVFEGASRLNASRSGSFQGTKTVDQMTPQEYWKHLEDQERQQTRG